MAVGWLMFVYYYIMCLYCMHLYMLQIQKPLCRSMSSSDIKVFVTCVIDPLNFWARVGTGMLWLHLYKYIISLWNFFLFSETLKYATCSRREPCVVYATLSYFVLEHVPVRNVYVLENGKSVVSLPIYKGKGDPLECSLFIHKDKVAELVCWT